MKLDNINDLFKKNPSILRFMVKHYENVPDHHIQHAHHMIITHQQALKEVKLVYTQYQSFQELYTALLRITNEIISSSLFFSNKISFLCHLEETNISYIEGKDDTIIIKIENYEELKKYGSPSWCIYNSPSTFDSYTQGGGRNQYILFDFNNKDNANFRIGFTHAVNYFVSYNHANKHINKEYINQYLTPVNHFNLTKIKNTPMKYKIKENFHDFLIIISLIAVITVAFNFINEATSSNEPLVEYQTPTMKVLSYINPVKAGLILSNYLTKAITDALNYEKINIVFNDYHVNEFSIVKCLGINIIDAKDIRTIEEVLPLITGEYGCLLTNRTLVKSGVLFYQKTNKF